jgi:hypothetical protein
VSVVRPSSSRNIFARIYSTDNGSLVFRILVNVIVIGLIVGCLVDVAAVVGAILGEVFILVCNFRCR